MEEPKAECEGEVEELEAEGEDETVEAKEMVDEENVEGETRTYIGGGRILVTTRKFITLYSFRVRVVTVGAK